MMNHNTSEDKNTYIYRLSWLAYLWPTGITVFFLLIGLNLSSSDRALLRIIGIVIVLADTAYFVRKIAILCTLKIMINEDGVFIFRGILPKTKSITGANWKDINKATCCPDMGIRIAKSYKIRISHCYAHVNELVVPFVKKSDKAISLINKRLISLHHD